MRTIDGDDLIKKVMEIAKEPYADPIYCAFHIAECRRFAAIVGNIPELDVEPVIHARWLDIIEHGWEKVICSNCKKYAPKDPLGWNIVKSRFCPNCGSVMNGGDTDD